MSEPFPDSHPLRAAEVVPRRLLVDCDTGIDDACALAYLAGTPGVRLAGVTTTSANATAAQSAHNSAYLLGLLGVDAEIAAGCPAPLVRELVTTPETHGPTGLGYATAPQAAASDRGFLDVWLDELRAHPGTTDLLVIGALTNLAVALREVPDLPDLLGRVVIMGGAFYVQGNTTPTAEWNAWVDPDAWHEVITAFEGRPQERLPVICSLGATERFRMTPERWDDVLAGIGAQRVRWNPAADRARVSPARTGVPVLDVLSDALRFYFEFHQDYDAGYFAILHDVVAAQVAAGTASGPLSVTTVDVEAGSDLLRGTTVRDDRGIWGRRPNARILESIDPDAVHREFAAGLGRACRRASGPTARR